jgi:hypothetical protein
MYIFKLNAKKILIYILSIFLPGTYSCTQTATHEVAAIEPGAIENNMQNWLNYSNKNINLSGHFIALDPAYNVISKEAFLKSLSSGTYLPLKLSSKEPITYKLHKLSSAASNDIRTTIKDLAETEYAHYKMEGKELPDFNFVDLNGNVYNKQTTKGKIVVLKCWFIKYQACVAEMPALNALVAQYKSRTDITFISLALDPKENLKKFLTTKTFHSLLLPINKIIWMN